MKRVRLLALAALTLCAFGAFGASAAFAEEESPAILCLEAKCAKTLEAKLKGTTSSLVDLLSGKTLTGTGVTVNVNEKQECTPTGVEEKDLTLCTDVPIDFTGVKMGAVNCRSEADNGTDKDALETVLALLDLHLAAEETSAKVLQPLLLAKVLGPLLENLVTVNCGGVKIVVHGTIACLLLPGLVEIPTAKEVEVLCKYNATTFDPETGTCTVLCKWLTEFPFLSSLGKELMDAWMSIHLKGKANKDIFIDD